MFTFNLKMISIESVYTSNLTFINPLALWFENSKKMLVISRYWFVTQQQTSTSRQQKSGSVYSNFSVEESELTPGF